MVCAGSWRGEEHLHTRTLLSVPLRPTLRQCAVKGEKTGAIALGRGTLEWSLGLVTGDSPKGHVCSSSPRGVTCRPSRYLTKKPPNAIAISDRTHVTSAFPVFTAGRLPHYLFRGLLSVHSHYGLHVRQVPYRTLYTRGFSRFVTSTTAPVATGRSESYRAGFAPAGRQRLCTAHANESVGRSTSCGMASPRRLFDGEALASVIAPPPLAGEGLGRGAMVEHELNTNS